MTVLYESTAGGRVEKEYDYVSAEEAQNLEAARVLADLGKRVVLLRTSKTKGAKSADAEIDGEKWEIKTNFTPTKSAIDTAIRNADKQADFLLLNVKSKITESRIEYVVKKRSRQTHLKKIVISKNGKIVFEMKK